MQTSTSNFFNKQTSTKLRFPFQMDKRLVFFLLSIGGILLSFITQKFILTSEVYYGTYGEQLSFQKINEFIAHQEQWLWLGYVFIPLYYLLKFFVITLCIMTGIVMFDLKIAFKQVFHAILLAETIFFIPAIIKTCWFIFISEPSSIEEVHHFYPLSIASIFDAGTLDFWLLYPFQLMNVFEISYWFFLAWCLASIVQMNFNSIFRLVLGSYGSSLLLWVFVVVFINVNFI